LGPISFADDPPSTSPHSEAYYFCFDVIEPPGLTHDRTLMQRLNARIPALVYHLIGMLVLRGASLVLLTRQSSRIRTQNHANAKPKRLDLSPSTTRGAVHQYREMHHFGFQRVNLP